MNGIFAVVAIAIWLLALHGGRYSPAALALRIHGSLLALSNARPDR
ncbi:MAG: hypothetical protein IIB75_00195 [Proteobacteria bacterium]|nr:hypothetical protein [Pseudomonadota bacterium]